MKISGTEKVLLITGKFPDVTSDIDGGSIMVSHLIDALHDNCILDVVFTRTSNASFKTIDGVKNTFFHTNKTRNENKFLRRLANFEWNSKMFLKLIPQYDKVIIIHCSKAFGLENLSEELLSKVILFPMYLTSSYLRSNELVPSKYSEAEQKILSKISKIITPSQSEKEDIIKDYRVAESKIIVIPRAINSNINGKLRLNSKSNKLIYIGAIKKQKRNDDAIILLSEIKKMGLKSHLYLVGSIQDNELYTQCLDLINNLDLENDITFCGVLSQKEIAILLNEMDINISVSRWETFGRGIFEGLCSGLPSVVYDNIDCLVEYANENNGITYVDNLKTMVDTVYDLCTNPTFYRSQSQKAIDLSSQFSIEKQKEKLLNEILFTKI
jgi:glycosyltransferase involved in cell wall biosynthesis